MSDILSQEEIDALLTAVASGGNDVFDAASASQPSPSSSNTAVMESAPAQENGAAWLFNYDDNEDDVDYSEKRLNLYDFRRPDRVSKDQMRVLENLYESYARQFSNTLTNYLRTLVEMRVASVEQFTYQEFIMSISNPSCIHLFRMEPIENTAIFEINPSLVFLIIDRLFGGFGKPFANNHELTPIVQNVIRSIVSRGLENLANSWEHMGDFSPKITNFETNPMFIQIAPPNETVILITFEVNISKSMGMMSICFPHKIIEKLFSYMTSESWITTKVQTTPETRKTMEEEIQDLHVPLSVLIGQTRLTVRDLLQLERDDILCLDKQKDEDLIIQIGGKSKMSGKSGIVGRRKAIRVTQIIEPEVPGVTSKYDRQQGEDELDEEEGD
jgi:flagellar motor switch protein FliM